MLKKTLNHAGLANKVEEAQVLACFKNIIDELFGLNTSDQVQARSLLNNTLIISSTSSSLSQEIFINSAKIIEMINKKNGKKIVEKISFH